MGGADKLITIDVVDAAVVVVADGVAEVELAVAVGVSIDSTNVPKCWGVRYDRPAVLHTGLPCNVATGGIVSMA